MYCSVPAESSTAYTPETAGNCAGWPATGVEGESAYEVEADAEHTGAADAAEAGVRAAQVRLAGAAGRKVDGRARGSCRRAAGPAAAHRGAMQVALATARRAHCALDVSEACMPRVWSLRWCWR